MGDRLTRGDTATAETSRLSFATYSKPDISGDGSRQLHRPFSTMSCWIIGIVPLIFSLVFCCLVEVSGGSSPDVECGINALKNGASLRGSQTSETDIETPKAYMTTSSKGTRGGRHSVSILSYHPHLVVKRSTDQSGSTPDGKREKRTKRRHFLRQKYLRFRQRKLKQNSANAQKQPNWEPEKVESTNDLPGKIPPYDRGTGNTNAPSPKITSSILKPSTSYKTNKMQIHENLSKTQKGNRRNWAIQGETNAARKIPLMRPYHKMKKTRAKHKKEKDINETVTHKNQKGKISKSVQEEDGTQRNKPKKYDVAKRLAALRKIRDRRKNRSRKNKGKRGKKITSTGVDDFGLVTLPTPSSTLAIIKDIGYRRYFTRSQKERQVTPSKHTSTTRTLPTTPSSISIQPRLQSEMTTTSPFLSPSRAKDYLTTFQYRDKPRQWPVRLIVQNEEISNDVQNTHIIVESTTESSTKKLESSNTDSSKTEKLKARKQSLAKKSSKKAKSRFQSKRNKKSGSQSMKRNKLSWRYRKERRRRRRMRAERKKKMKKATMKMESLLSMTTHDPSDFTTEIDKELVTPLYTSAVWSTRGSSDFPSIEESTSDLEVTAKTGQGNRSFPNHIPMAPSLLNATAEASRPSSTLPVLEKKTSLGGINLPPSEISAVTGLEKNTSRLLELNYTTEEDNSIDLSLHNTSFDNATNALNYNSSEHHLLSLTPSSSVAGNDSLYTANITTALNTASAELFGDMRNTSIPNTPLIKTQTNNSVTDSFNETTEIGRRNATVNENYSPVSLLTNLSKESTSTMASAHIMPSTSNSLNQTHSDLSSNNTSLVSNVSLETSRSISINRTVISSKDQSHNHEDKAIATPHHGMSVYASSYPTTFPYTTTIGTTDITSTVSQGPSSTTKSSYSKWRNWARRRRMKSKGRRKYGKYPKTKRLKSDGSRGSVAGSLMGVKTESVTLEPTTRAPFVTYKTAYDFLSKQRVLKGIHGNEERRESYELNRVMAENMCEIFDKHFVPTSIGGKCV